MTNHDRFGNDHSEHEGFTEPTSLESYFEPVPRDARDLIDDGRGNWAEGDAVQDDAVHRDAVHGGWAQDDSVVVDLPPPPPGDDDRLASVVPIRDDQPPSLIELIDEAIEFVASARPAAMSATVKVNRDDLLEILEEAREAVPEEVRAARWLLKEKDDFLAAARHERDQIIDQGRTQVARMVERQEVLRAAESKARQIVDEARSEARTTKRQVEDYCDRKLASFEELLGRTSRTVQQGREKLMAPIDLTDVDLNEDPNRFESQPADT